MVQQQAFFLSEFEIFQKENPEKFQKKTRSSTGRSVPKTFDCASCGLDKKSVSGRITRTGRNGTILIVGLCPSKQDDDLSTLFSGSSGAYLNSTFRDLGVNFYKDCTHTNIVQCACCEKSLTGRRKYGTVPSKRQMKCCQKNLEKDIEEVKPDLIICFGGAATKAVLSPESVKLPNNLKMHGKVIPSQKRGCWVGSMLPPGNILAGRKRDHAVFVSDLSNILSKLGEPFPKPLTMVGNHIVLDSEEAVEILEELSRSEKPVAFDYETNGLYSQAVDAKLLTVGLSNDVSKGYCIHLANPNWNLIEQSLVFEKLAQFLDSPVPKVVQNYNMEELWSRDLVGVPMRNFIWDTMVSTHVLNCRTGTTGLAFQVYEMVGDEYKDMVDASNLENEPIELVGDYNCLDARYTLMAYYYQKARFEELDDKQLTDFNTFYSSCIEVLGNLKDRGIRIDKQVLDQFYADYSKEVTKSLELIAQNSGVQEFEKLKEKSFNPGSSKQLGEVLYGIQKVPSVKKTATGESTDAEALGLMFDQTKNQDAKDLIGAILRSRKITKFLERVVQYQTLMDYKNVIHPSYTLNIAESFRSSALDPNSQNVYKRDKELVKFRKVIIPSPGNILLECDYDALEVKVIAMASKDKELTRQIIAGHEWALAHPEGGVNPFDPHYHWASEIFQKDPKDITSEERYNAKNGFVFPSFYGSVDTSIARAFPTVTDKHISRMQAKFWEEYSGVKDWQNQTLALYDLEGYVRGVSGFIRPGPLSVNKLYNTPIQGTAFHLLLDGLRAVDIEILRRGLKSRAFLEVHDSITFDTPMEEVEEIIDLVNTILCSKRFEWQGNIPTTISWEMGENWYDMSSI